MTGRRSGRRRRGRRTPDVAGARNPHLHPPPPAPAVGAQVPGHVRAHGSTHAPGRRSGKGATRHLPSASLRGLSCADSLDGRRPTRVAGVALLVPRRGILGLPSSPGPVTVGVGHFGSGTPVFFPRDPRPVPLDRGGPSGFRRGGRRRPEDAEGKVETESCPSGFRTVREGGSPRVEDRPRGPLHLIPTRRTGEAQGRPLVPLWVVPALLPVLSTPVVSGLSLVVAPSGTHTRCPVSEVDVGGRRVCTRGHSPSRGFGERRLGS